MREKYVLGIAGPLILLVWGATASGQSIEPLGNITAIEGVVNVYHEGQLEVESVKLAGPMMPKDFYETRPKSKLKLLLRGEGLLSLGENTRIKISDNVLVSAQGQHKTIVDLISGTVRARVGKVPAQPVPRLEIRTPTAVITAQGTYFVVWVSEGSNITTGVANIGKSGDVMVGNIDSSVKDFLELGQNQYTQIVEGKPPTPASRIDPKLLKDLLNRTEVDDQTAEQIPRGMEAPGSDISKEKVISIVTGGPSGGSFPTTPPIFQQPRQPAGIGSTPVSVNLEFPK
jgi:hypothetical protein